MSLSMQDIHCAIRNLQHEGHNLDSVESFLVNDLDLKDLLSSMDEYRSGHVPHNLRTGQIKICGVKIIESHYVPRGLIFKVFKNAKKQFTSSYYNGYYNNTCGTEMIPKQTRAFMDTDTPTAIKQKQPVNKKHSQTRKIELGA